MHRVTTLAIVILLSGCLEPVDDDPTKQEIRQLIEEGEAEGEGDLCAEHGFYGDGECDDWCPDIDPDCESEAVACGGFASLECPEGLVCVDDPDDDCDPEDGGADCLGLCVEDSEPEPEYELCGGIGDDRCPEGLLCVDDPEVDVCDYPYGGFDCSGICVDVTDLPTCGGIAGRACPEGLSCVDDTADDCRPDLGDADCMGYCL